MVRCLGEMLGLTISKSVAELLNFPKKELGRGAWSSISLKSCAVEGGSFVLILVALPNPQVMAVRFPPSEN